MKRGCEIVEVAPRLARLARSAPGSRRAAAPVAAPSAARSARSTSALPRLGDVALLRPRARARSTSAVPAIGGRRVALARPGRRARAVDPLERLLHPLRRQHAAVVVRQDQPRLVAQPRGDQRGETPTSASATASGAWARSSLVRSFNRRPVLLRRSSDTTCTSKPLASRTSRSGIDRPERCLQHGWCDRPTTMWPTLCERAKSRMASTGSASLQAHHLGAQLARMLDVGQQVALGLGVDLVGRLLRRLDEDHEPVGVEPAGQPRALAQQRRAPGATPTTGRPSPGCRGPGRCGCPARARLRAGRRWPARRSRPPRAAPARAGGPGSAP